MNMKLIATTGAAIALAAQAFSQTSFSAGALTVRTGSGNDSFFVRVGPLAGEVTLEGVPGLPGDVVYRGVISIDVQTGLGDDQVYVVHEGAFFPTLSVNTGAGEGLFELDMRVPVSAAALTSRVRYTGGPAKDTFLARVESLANNLNLDWISAGGQGDNETVAQVVSGGRTARLGFRLAKTGGLNQDRVQVDIEANTARLETIFTGTTGDGDDEFMVNAKGTGLTTATGAFNLNLGAGNDKALAEYTESRTIDLSGVIRGQDGSDILDARANRPLTGSLLMEGGNGNDTLHLYSNGPIIGSPRLLAGAGNDLVEMWGTIAVGSPFSDGGPGFDYFKGIGSRINFEVIN